MGPADTWKRLEEWLRSVPSTLPETPTAILVVSGHWEEDVPTVLSATAPPLLYDYYGFPKHTYELTWPAPGSPTLATRVIELLAAGGIEAKKNDTRGFDHGVFVPLKVAFPEANTPTLQLSLRASLDPAEHLAIGRALAPLRGEGVLIIGSGMSYHNMRGFGTASGRADSERFDAWLASSIAEAPEERNRLLRDWTHAPAARESHPREEHLIPLMVAAGAAGSDLGTRVFSDAPMSARVSAVRFG